MGNKPRNKVVGLAQIFKVEVKRLLYYVKNDLVGQVKGRIEKEKVKGCARREKYGKFFAFVINLFSLSLLLVVIFFLLTPGSIVLGVPIMIALLFGL